MRVRLPGFWTNSTESTVAGLCGERCLNTAGCAGFLSGRITSTHQRNSGQCVLLRGSASVAGEPLERAAVPSTAFDMFLRNDAPNPCDASNGGCGDVAFTSCTATLTSFWGQSPARYSALQDPVRAA